MPAKSEAQRKCLNAKFGHKWVKKHHFDNPGKLPEKVGEGLSRPCNPHDITWGGKGYHCLNCGATADHSWNIKHAEQPKQVQRRFEALIVQIVDELLNEG